MEYIYEIKTDNLMERTNVDSFTKDIVELTEDEKFNKVILDMGKVKKIGSFCIGGIVCAFKTMKYKNGKLIIKNVNEQIKKIFETFGLLKILTFEE